MKAKKASKDVLHSLGLRRQRDFKALKRTELRGIIAAWQIFHSGCAYVPGYPHAIWRLDDAIKELTRLLSAKEWGR